MQLSGTLLKIERKEGKFENEAGKSIPYDFTLLHILSGAEVLKVRLPKDVHNVGVTVGEVVDVEVSFPANTKIFFQGLLDPIDA